MNQEKGKKGAASKIFVPMLDLTKITQQGYNPNNEYYIEDNNNNAAKINNNNNNNINKSNNNNKALALFEAAEALKTDNFPLSIEDDSYIISDKQ